jgi:protein-tyrosine phosphatase
VLVHCAGGISRGPAILISYIIKKYNKTFETAFEQVRAGRKQAFPNRGFQRQLRGYERKLGL